MPPTRRKPTCKNLPFDPEADARRRWEVLRRSQLNRSMARLEQLIERLREQLQELAEYSAETLIEDWLAAGLPMPDPDAAEGYYERYIDGLLAMADNVPRDAAGFLWCVENFLGVLVANSIAPRRSRSR